MTGDEDQPMAEARAEAGRGRLARHVAYMSTRMAIRWPALAVLRLPELSAWVVLSNIIAVCVAPAYASASTGEVRNTAAYMQGWCIVALSVACLWIARQWRDRSSLPARHALPVAWSPGASALILALILSPVVSGGYSVDSRIRALRSRDQLLHDLRILERAHRRVVSRSEQGSFPSQSQDFIRDRIMSDSAELLTNSRELTRDELDALGRYAARGWVTDVNNCVVSTRSAPTCVDVRIHCAYSDVWNDCSATERTCAGAVVLDCGVYRAGLQIANSVVALTRAHGYVYSSMMSSVIPVNSPSEDPETLFALAGIAILLGIIAGCASVVSFGLVISTCMLVAMIVMSVPVFDPLLASFGIRIGYPLGHIVHTREPVASILAVALHILVLVFGAVRWRSRTLTRDLCLILVLLGPLTVVLIGLRKPGAHMWQSNIPTAVIVAVLLGFIITPFISRYRKLPWTT